MSRLVDIAATRNGPSTAISQNNRDGLLLLYISAYVYNPIKQIKFACPICCFSGRRMERSKSRLDIRTITATRSTGEESGLVQRIIFWKERIVFRDDRSLFQDVSAGGLTGYGPFS